MKDKTFYLILASLMILLAILMLAGCLRSPQREESAPPPCYEYKMCLYYLQKSPDKSLCKDAMIECLKYYRLDKCLSLTENGDKRLSFQSCLDKLE